MKWSELGEMDCPIARSLAILGDRWTLLIIRNAFLKVRRFDDFQSQLGITRHVLAERIKRLVDHEIFEKVIYNQSHNRYEYKLTEKGKALYPIIVSISIWGNKWNNENTEYSEIYYVHTSCHNQIVPKLVCPCCNEEVDSRLMLPFFKDTFGNPLTNNLTSS